MSKRSALFQVTLACAWTISFAAASEQANAPVPVQRVDALVEQPRSFGHFIGDVLEQRVLLDTATGKFEPKLPRAERVGVWFERRPSRIETTRQDGRRWLVLEYQIINAPKEVATVELPSFNIADASGTRELTVPAWSISVAPLTTPPATDDLSQIIRADRESPRIPTRPIWRKLVAFGTACAIFIAAWLAWLGWRNWIARREQPFARAWTDVHALSEQSPEAWQAMHRAFDRTAGRVIQSSTLAALFQAAPHFIPQRVEIERFYSQSSELFFGRGLPQDALSVRELCRELRRVERRHE